MKNGEFAEWWKKGAKSLIQQVRWQKEAANGFRIQWHFAEEAPANATRVLFKEKEMEGIEIIVKP